MSTAEAEASGSTRSSVMRPLRLLFDTMKTSTQANLPAAFDGVDQERRHQKLEETPPKPPPQSRALPSSWPNCTHISMIRLHGDHICWHCRRIPDFGWVYGCAQDNAQQEALYTHKRNLSNDSVQSTHSASTEYFTPMKAPYIRTRSKSLSPLDFINELTAAGFDQSVVDGTVKGVYTVDQLIKIIGQKRKVQTTIRAQEMKRNARDTRTFSMPGAFTITPPLTPEKDSASETPKAKGKPESRGLYIRARPKKPSSEQPKCSFQACHTCRPFYKDRCFVSFEAAYQDELRPITTQESIGLHWNDARKLQQMGLRVAMRRLSGIFDSAISQFSSISTTPGESLDGDNMYDSEISVGFDSDKMVGSDPAYDTLASQSPSASGQSMSKIELRRALTGIPGGHGPTSSAAVSSVTLPLEGTGALRSLHQPAGDFDLALFRKMQRDGDPAMSRPLQTSVFTLAMDQMAGEGRAVTPNDEVEVEGGVALTEESIEMRVPDVLTQA